MHFSLELNCSKMDLTPLCRTVMNSLFMDCHLLPHPQCPSPAPPFPLLAAVTSLSSSQLTQLGGQLEFGNFSAVSRSIRRFPATYWSISWCKGRQLFPWHGQQFSLQLVQQQGLQQLGKLFGTYRHVWTSFLLTFLLQLGKVDDIWLCTLCRCTLHSMQVSRVPCTLYRCRV